MRVYELTYDHQWEGQSLGFFISPENALAFLRKYLKDDTITITMSFPEYGAYRLSAKDYSITAQGVIQ